jgi:hypothetical protein
MTARASGNRLVRELHDYLVERGLWAQREHLHGAFDRGDETLPRLSLTIEVKRHQKDNLTEFWRQTERERDRNGHRFAAIVHKRWGKGKIEDQWVTMDLKTFVEIMLDLQEKG